MLLAARERMDPKGPASRRVALIEAWNEWGEGSTVEPDLEDGFAKVDAIREVFAAGAGAHVDVAPQDLGLPLIEWPAGSATRAWRFARAEDWKGWSSASLSGREIAGDRLRFRTSGGDPYIVSPIFATPARTAGTLEIRMSTSSETDAQVFWQTEDASGMSELRSLHFSVHPGGMTTYKIALSQSAHWRGVITRLRIDPATKAGVDLELESIALVK